MNEFQSLYKQDYPIFIAPYLASKSMQRLKRVDMNCGLQFTSHAGFSSYGSYSRYEHSVGVACIIWYFTHDKKQTLAGLFHDISTRAFSHVIDFVRKDYLVQESTEDNTRQFILQDSVIMNQLLFDGISVDEVFDYHVYPIADNDAPRLSADRLEYTLGNLLNYRKRTIEEIEKYYKDLTVGISEDGKQEMMFQNPNIAEEFAFGALSCGMIYSCDFDRYGMEKLAEILRKGLKDKTLTESDLYLSEVEVVNKLSHSDLRNTWYEYTRLYDVVKDSTGDIMVNAKKRYIDPYVCKHGRVTTFSAAFKNAVNEFKNIDYQYLMKGIYRNG